MQLNKSLDRDNSCTRIGFQVKGAVSQRTIDEGHLRLRPVNSVYYGSVTAFQSNVDFVSPNCRFHISDRSSTVDI
jgi:hypothetical protein